MIRLLRLVFAVVAAVYVIIFAIANRGTMELTFVPAWLSPDVAPVSAPIWVVVLVVLILGIVLGSMATWLEGGDARYAASKAQGKVRRQEIEAQIRERQETEAAIKRAAEKRAAAKDNPPAKKIPPLPTSSGDGLLALPTR